MKTNHQQSIIGETIKVGGDNTSQVHIRMPELVLLNAHEFGCIFNIAPITAKEWRRDGIIPYVRIKGHIYYRLSDVLKTIDSHTLRNDPKLLQK